VALAEGGLVTTMQNEHGVVMRRKSTSSGVELKAGVEFLRRAKTHADQLVGLDALRRPGIATL
jgi:hypothetical protein